MTGPDAIVLLGTGLTFGGIAMVCCWVRPALDLTLSAVTVITTAAATLFAKGSQA